MLQLASGPFFMIKKASTGNPRKMQPLLTALGTLVFLYLAGAVAAHFFANLLIFPVFPSSYTAADYPLVIRTDNGLDIAAYHQEQPGNRFTVLYSHGNGEDLGGTRYALDKFSARGYNVFAYDYPGYGLSDGKAGVTNTYHSAVAAYRYLTEEKGVDPARLLLYGRSLGSGPSLYLAERFPVGGVILDGAFVSTFRVKTVIPIYPHDKFQNLRRIRRLEVPLLVLHGRLDTTVPFWHGKALYDAAPGPKWNLWLDQAGHNNIEEVGGQAYWKAIRELNEHILPTEPTPQT